MEKLVHILWQVRMVVITISFLGGGGLAVWQGIHAYRITSAEPGPTSLSLNSVEFYGGQRWLTIEHGVFLTDQAVVRSLPRSRDNAEDQVILCVPTVQRGWQPSSAVASGPSPSSQAEKTAA